MTVQQMMLMGFYVPQMILLVLFVPVSTNFLLAGMLPEKEDTDNLVPKVCASLLHCQVSRLDATGKGSKTLCPRQRLP